MKKLIIFIFIISVQTLIGQNKSESFIRIFKFNVLAPSFEYELGVSENTSLDFKIGTGLLVNGGSGRSTDWSLFPFFEIQYRHYYNFLKRKGRNRNISFNSGNYIGITSNIQSGKSLIGSAEYFESHFTTFGPVWGLQRNYNGGFNVNFNLGVGYQLNDKSSGIFVPILDISLGWVL